MTKELLFFDFLEQLNIIYNWVVVWHVVGRVEWWVFFLFCFFTTSKACTVTLVTVQALLVEKKGGRFCGKRGGMVILCFV